MGVKGTTMRTTTPWGSSCTACALRAHCVRTACILRTQRLGYSPKNTSHLSSSTAKQQSPNENNETAFNLVINCRYEHANQPCKVQVCKGMQDAHMFKWQAPHSDISPGGGHATSNKHRHHFPPLQRLPPPVPIQTLAHEAKVHRVDT